MCLERIYKTFATHTLRHVVWIFADDETQMRGREIK